MKKILYVSLCALLCVLMILPVMAQGPSRLVDNADILTEAQEQNVLSVLDRLSEKNKCDIVIVTTNDTGSKTMMEYADDYFDYNGYSENGVLLLVNMKKRDMWISTSGTCIDKIPDVDVVFDVFSNYISNGEYENGFITFAEACSNELSPDIFDHVIDPNVPQEFSRLVDNADLLTEAQEQNVLSVLDRLSEKHECDIVIVTTNHTGSKTMMEYADDYFDYNGYSANGVLLLVNMQKRDMWISTSGTCIDEIPNVDVLFNQFADYISFGDYEEGFIVFAEACSDELSPNVFACIVIAVIAGLIVALIGTGILKKQLVSVQKNDNANSYVREGSLNLTVNSDRFLYRNVSKTVRQSSSSSGGSTHRGSSGRSHGGGGRSF